MNAELSYYLSLFLRRIHYFLLFATAGLAVGLTLAFTKEPVYRAQARLIVESSQIPGELALSTVRASARTGSVSRKPATRPARSPR